MTSVRSVVVSANHLVSSCSVRSHTHTLKHERPRTHTHAAPVDLEDDDAGDALLDENNINQAPRPGTSFQKPKTAAANGGGDAAANALNGGVNQSMRPMTGQGLVVRWTRTPACTHNVQTRTL
jgi:hypothetical protein